MGEHMRRVRIYKHSSIDEEQLKKLLADAGCPADEEGDAEESADAEVGTEASAEVAQEDHVSGEQEDIGPPTAGDHGVQEVCEPDTLVVVLTPELDDDSLEVELRRETDCGTVVVGVWPKGVPSGVASPAFKKYSGDQVVWDPDAVRRAIRGCGTEPAYQDPTGAPQPAPETPRHCC
jgi:hypothetical protein